MDAISLLNTLKLPDDPLTGELGVFKNKDGSFSTERSISVQFGDRHFNLPTLVKGQLNPADIANGKQLTEQQLNIAIERFKARGGLENNPGFATPEEAKAAAIQRSNAGGSSTKFNFNPFNPNAGK